MKLAIQERLGQLVGQPLWAVGRAGLVWFQFGDRHVVRTMQGDTKEVGSYALHLQCPWSWTRSWGELIVDWGSDHEDLSDSILSPVVCVGVEAGNDGSFRMMFNDHSILIVQPQPDHESDDYDEYWRLFEPHRKTPHFIVGSRGVET